MDVMVGGLQRPLETGDIGGFLQRGFSYSDELLRVAVGNRVERRREGSSFGPPCPVLRAQMASFAAKSGRISS
jgi:hypothetical protein